MVSIKILKFMFSYLKKILYDSSSSYDYTRPIWLLSAITSNAHTHAIMYVINHRNVTTKKLKIRKIDLQNVSAPKNVRQVRNLERLMSVFVNSNKYM